MKADNTRSTFKGKKHYSSVRMQQGRVQLDADWNEQMDITAHRVETETFDSIGHCGAPVHHGGFHLVKDVGDLTKEEKKRPENKNEGPLKSVGDFYISGGRYYVDGILCENENIVPFSKQPDVPLDSLPPDFPGLKEILKEIQPPSQSGTFLAYMDVWSRHITALEDKEIREVALGGPDTATRTKTVWQVKLLRVGGTNAIVNCLSSKDWDALVKRPNGKLAARVEEKEEKDKPCIVAPGAGYRRLENQLYRVEVHEGGSRGKATFKWSRDNGSIVAKWGKKDADKLTVSSTGRDNVLNFSGGQWVELTDDTHELLGQPGTLVKLKKVEKEGNVLTIDSATATGPVELASFPDNPRVCRWDMGGNGAIKPTNSKFIDLEDGVQVQFSSGTYKTGDYWLIPARTATGNVEWPVADTGKPELQPPQGIRHHYCRLSLLRFNGSKWTDISDCRKIFPPVTELTSLLYVSGDGQEAMPGNKLDWPLQVRAVNGQHPVTGAKVEFILESGAGTLSVSGPVESTSEGMAACEWTLGMSGKQQVKAVLLDDAAQPIPGQVIYFNADLSIAGHVAYDPAGCSKWKDSSKIKTVKDAIDELCMREHKGGCAVTIGKDGGEYPDLVTALASARIQKAGEICLCFLPGDHLIEKDVQEKKNSIKIVGCGAKIRMTADILSFAANRIVLADIGLHVENDGGQVVLTGQIIDVEGCEFVRSADAQGPPLVQIQSRYPGKVNTELRWKANKMEAWWIETIPEKVSDFFMPVADIEYSAEARDRLVKLSKMNPYEKKEEFERALEMIAKDIEKLPVASRVAWFERRSTRRINKLPQQQKAAIESLFEVIKSERFTAKLKLKLRENLKAVFKAFHIFYYADAIALTRGVGGWLEDNVINGYVSLHYTDAKSSYLNWPTGKSEGEIERQNKNKRKWVQEVMKGKDYIQVQSVSLNLRGNDFYAVRSNAPSIMKIIGNIRKSGKGVLKDLDLAYKSLTATDNIFHSNGNSFVSETVIMQGNQFIGGIQEWSVVANVLGYIGIFMGNLAPQPNRRAIVECILRQPPLKAANFLRIENFS